VWLACSPQAGKEPAVKIALCVMRTFCYFLTLIVPALSLYGQSQPDFFSFEELRQLSVEAKPAPELEKKLDGVLHTPVVGDFTGAGAQPVRPVVARLGPVLRALFWNIERGQNFDLVRLALSDPDGLAAEAEKKAGATPATLALIREQVALLKQADLLILNELDIGMKRSDYHDVGRELAEALKMHYVYGVEFVELDPVMLGIEKVDLEDKELEASLQKELQADPQQLRALHGTAILSRYPIHDPRIVRLPECHDWYAEESKPVPFIEKMKRTASEKVFLEELASERRRGGRIAIVARLDVPEAPGGITVAAAHLENKCTTKCRLSQMDFLLDQLKSVTGPVILAGDMNTTGSDGAILSLPYLLQSKAKDYRFWGQRIVSIVNPLNFYGAGSVVNYTRKYTDPTVHDIPLIANNREYKLFKHTRNFRFDDGGAFDFRGIAVRTVNGTGRTLADSNQRDGKGFAYTFALPRDYGGTVGRYKLDWFFIKPPGPGQNEPTDQVRPFTPWFARTYQDVNQAPADRISDHAPMTVDLPLTKDGGK
jgi:endonuclease/exonuclease/phosphatase family metal-dependent hydrolase